MTTAFASHCSPGTYSAGARERCVRTGVYLPSYVEWLTCLEMERDVRNLRREPTPGMPKR